MKPEQLLVLAFALLANPAFADPWNAPVTLQAGAFQASAKTTMRVDSDIGDVGTQLDLERHLGVRDRRTVPHVELLWRFAPRHGIEGSWVALERNGTLGIVEQIRFGDATFSIDETLDTTFETEEARLAYRYSIIHDARNEVALLLGASHTTLRTSISASFGGISESASLRGLLPMIGVRASTRFADDWRVRGFVQFLGARIGDYDTEIGYAGAAVERAFLRRAYAGLGYNHYRYRVETERRDLRGLFRHRFDGPTLYVGLTF